MTTYTIIIPVFNGFNHVKRCIESVLRNTPKDCRIILVDDGSTEPRIREFREWSTLIWLVNETCQGFVKSVNRAIAADGAIESAAIFCFSEPNDVIILNSDTVVPPGWVERLDAARYFGDRKVAAVCPLSNNATIFSVPTKSQAFPEFTDQSDAMVCQYSDHAHPEIPTVNGFCMLLSREALNEIGHFDEIFGRGYGEEVDWCQRARAAGYVCALADDLYVYHQGRASFGDERAELAERAEAIVRERWPNYADDVQAWIYSDPLRRLKTRLVFGRRGDLPRSYKLKVCHIQHSFGPRGGVENLTSWLIEAMPDVESTVIIPASHGALGGEQAESAFEGSTLVTRVNREMLGAEVTFRGIPMQPEQPSIMGAPVSDVLSVARPDIVQINHLAFWGNSKLIERAHQQGAKVVLTLHDDFLLCPRLKDIDCGKSEARGAYCANCLLGVCEAKRYVGLGEVEIYLEYRHDAVRASLDEADAIVVPSATMSDRFDAVHPGIGEKIRVIQNGIPPQRFTHIKHVGHTLRVGFVGTCTNHKGFEFVRRVVNACNWLVEWHVFGAVDPELDLKGLEKVKFRGPYDPEHLAQLLQEIDLAVPLLAHNEAYGLVVDECLAAGVSVALPDLPVILERIDCAATYKFGDAQSFLSNMVGIKDASGIRTIEQCAADYLELYREVMGCRTIGDEYRSAYSTIEANMEADRYALLEAANRDILKSILGKEFTE